MKHETTRSARVIKVIRTSSLRGDGVDDPIREVTQYWSLKGRFLAEHDPERLPIGQPGEAFTMELKFPGPPEVVREFKS